MSDLFVKFGGHKHAAGLTLDPARVDEFRQRFNDYARSRLQPEDFEPLLRDGCGAPNSAMHRRHAVEELFTLAPFGHSNPPPLFAALDVEIAAPPTVMKEKHLRLTVKQNGRFLKLKAWNFAERTARIGSLARASILRLALEEDAYSAARGYAPWGDGAAGCAARWQRSRVMMILDESYDHDSPEDAAQPGWKPRVHVPTGLPQTDVDVLVIVQPSPQPAQEWPSGFFEETYGAFKDDPLQRPGEGEFRPQGTFCVDLPADTNACIRYLNGRSPRSGNGWSAPNRMIRLCSIVKAELLYGAAKSQIFRIDTIEVGSFLLHV